MANASAFPGDQMPARDAIKSGADVPDEGCPGTIIFGRGLAGDFPIKQANGSTF